MTSAKPCSNFLIEYQLNQIQFTQTAKGKVASHTKIKMYGLNRRASRKQEAADKNLASLKGTLSEQKKCLWTFCICGQHMYSLPAGMIPIGRGSCWRSILESFLSSPDSLIHLSCSPLTASWYIPSPPTRTSLKIYRK